MTGMLASVNSVVEAEAVLNMDVDIIDIKNPLEGALGALEVNAVKEIVQICNSEILTSATIGDIKSDDPKLLDYIDAMAKTGVDYVKVGLFEQEASDYFIKTITEAANKDIKLVIVIFAENYQDKKSINPLLQTGIVGIMLDTKEKKGKNLRMILNDVELQSFVEMTKEFNLLSGLAGSLRFEDVESLLLFNSDYLGFRGALCSGNDRVKTISLEQIKKIRDAIPLSKYINYANRAYKEASI